MNMGQVLSYQNAIQIIWLVMNTKDQFSKFSPLHFIHLANAHTKMIITGKQVMYMES